MTNTERADSPTADSQGRVLVVDDEAANRKLISGVLAREGYDVVTAQNGLDALTHLALQLPDLIISDLRMPRMSGVEFLSLVRRKHPQVPLLVISGEFEGNEVPPGVPANAYLQKGQYTLCQLRTKVTDLLSETPGKPAQAQ